MTHGGAGPGPVLLLVVVAAVGYEVAATTAARPWPRWRTFWFLTGCALLVAGFTPDALPWPAHDLRHHVLQHLVLGMLAPLALVLGAPVTLLLRVLPRAGARAIGRLLRRPAVHVLAHPVTALTLSAGGLAAVHLTPLYAATVRDPGLHLLVQVHFVLAGYLFAWVIAGVDPAPARPSVPARLVVLGVAIAVHTALSHVVYAGGTGPPVPADQRQGAAELLYYGGDLAELLLAAALVSRWRPGPGTSSARGRRPPAGSFPRPGRLAGGRPRPG